MQGSDLLSVFLSIWNFQLFAIDGSAITLGKLVVGLVLTIMGYFLAKIASLSISRRVIGRFNMEKSFQYTLQRLTFYGFYIVVILFTLQLLSIPITIFAVMGGALAIGVGFGSQNVVNNFISGLIVMIEQPVRVGDWIELDGVFGHVEQIGGRSTTIRTMQNKQAIIPNSFFLEKMFTNWTLTNNVVTGSLTVGVAYGADVNLVRTILLEAASGHAEIIKTPSPFVIFQNFGESSLDFQLHYCVLFSAETTVVRVGSDLRYRIDELFRLRGVSIPFPHRELIIRSMPQGSELK